MMEEESKMAGYDSASHMAAYEAPHRMIGLDSEGDIARLMLRQLNTFDEEEKHSQH